MEEDNSVYKSVVIFLLSICVISLSLGIYANYRLIVISKENQKHKEQETNKKENEVEEKIEIDDEATLELIKRRQIVLNNYTGDQITFKKSRIYEKNLKNKDLEEDKKLVAVLYTLYENDKNYEELDRKKYPNIEPSKEGNTLVISSEIVKGLYSDVFSGSLDVNTPLPEEVKNNFYYNSEYDVFVINTGFGGTCVEKTLTYDYKFMEDKNRAYVYSAMAYEANCPYEIYKDFNKTDKYETEGNFELKEDNYKDFNKYLITYNKDGDKYIFESIELIK